MNKVVIYQSQTGFTKQYAEWIAEGLGCEAVELKQAAKKNISENDVVIFGGWIMGNTISGLETLKRLQPKKLVVFGVGGTPEDIADTELIQKQNNLEAVPFFYMEGGFRFEQLNFIEKGMLKLLKKQAARKENKSVQEEFMAKALGTSYDSTDKKKTEKLIKYIETM